MLHFRRSTMLMISAAVWLVVGVSLLTLGLKLVLSALEPTIQNYPLLTSLTGFVGMTEYAVVLVIALALMIGRAKGRVVMARAASRAAERFKGMQEPVAIWNLYDRRFLILIACMMGLGMALRFLQVPPDIRGGVNIAIGAALIHGAMTQIKMGLELKSS